MEAEIVFVAGVPQRDPARHLGDDRLQALQVGLGRALDDRLGKAGLEDRARLQGLLRGVLAGSGSATNSASGG